MKRFALNGLIKKLYHPLNEWYGKSMHQSFVTTAPPPKGDSGKDVPGFYLCIIPAVPVMSVGFHFCVKIVGIINNVW